MDATTFMQMQQDAQNQIDALNAQIATLTQQKNDLINTNNTSITTTKAQCDQMITDATTQANGIVSTATTQAQIIADNANKTKSDADQYVVSQQANINTSNATLKEGQDALTVSQDQLNKESQAFTTTVQSIIGELTDAVSKAKTYLDSAITEISALGSVPDATKV